MFYLYDGKICGMEGFLDSLKISYSDNQRITPATKSGVIFIHGFPLNRSSWASQIKSLDATQRVIAYDQRGHGGSPASAIPYLFESLVDDLFGLLDHLQLDRAILCGLSMGGYVALRAMERDPNRFKALILSDTKSEGDPDTARLNRAKDVAMITKDGVRTYASVFARRCLTPETVSGQPTLVKEVEDIIAKNAPAAMQATLVALATRTDTTESLSKIRVPTLILVGEKDAVTPPAAAKNLHDRIQGSQLVTIPNSAHFSNLENPSAFNAALTSFLSTLPSD